jgi:hypothetical protein
MLATLRGNFFDLFMAPYSQGQEAPQNPGRFTLLWHSPSLCLSWFEIDELRQTDDLIADTKSIKNH